MSRPPFELLQSRRITALRELNARMSFKRGVIGSSCTCPSEDVDPCEACVRVATTGRFPNKRTAQQETGMSKAKMEVYQDSKGEFRWRVRARNGLIIGASSEGYTHRDDCWKNAALLSTAITAALADRKDPSSG